MSTRIDSQPWTWQPGSRKENVRRGFIRIALCDAWIRIHNAKLAVLFTVFGANVSLLISCLSVLLEISSSSWAYSTAQATVNFIQFVLRLLFSEKLLEMPSLLSAKIKEKNWSGFGNGFSKGTRLPFCVETNRRIGYISHCSTNTGQMQDVFVAVGWCFSVSS